MLDEYDVERAIVAFLIFGKIIKDQFQSDSGKFKEDIVEVFLKNKLHIQCLKFGINFYNNNKSNRNKLILKYNIQI